MQRPSNENELEDINEGDFLDSLADDDYVFVLDSEGNLKSVLMPEINQDSAVPDNVESVLKFFGVSNMDPVTLH